MVRSTSAQLDVSAAPAALLDHLRRGRVLSRFGAAVAAESIPGRKPGRSSSVQPAHQLTARPLTHPPPKWQVAMNRSYRSPALARHTLAGLSGRPADRGRVQTCRSLEFHRAVEVIAVGRAGFTQACAIRDRRRLDPSCVTIEADQTPVLVTACFRGGPAGRPAIAEFTRQKADPAGCLKAANESSSANYGKQYAGGCRDLRGRPCQRAHLGVRLCRRGHQTTVSHRRRHQGADRELATPVP